jgi:DNA-binding NtrC family response regulator
MSNPSSGQAAVAPVHIHGPEDVAILLDGDACPEPLLEMPARLDAAPFGAIVERLVEALAEAGDQAITNALRIVKNEANALGATLGEWTGRGEARLIAFCGPVTKTTEQLDVCRHFIEAFRRRDSEPFTMTTIVANDMRYVCAALGQRRHDLLTFVMWGDASARFDDLTLVRIFLRLIERTLDPQRSARAPRGRSVPADVELPGELPPSHVPGRSAAMRETYRQMRVFAGADFPLLVIGETGVGKEHIVRAMHAWSRRRQGPFVAVNCAAIPDTLLEAEMFGIGRGVASGVHEREGKFGLAAGGTLFLDEIGELPLPLQAKLLRVLQDHQVTPVGGRPVEVDVRVIAATNADLEEKLRLGAFRSDLYYRIAGSVVRVPPLRERRSDIARLVEHFLHKFAGELDRPIRGLSVRGLELLVQHSWPGNVRELESEVRRLVYACAPGQVIESSLLSERVMLGGKQASPTAGSTLQIATRVAELERDLILQALQRSRGNRSVAARLLGLSRNGLALKMHRLDVD